MMNSQEAGRCVDGSESEGGWGKTAGGRNLRRGAMGKRCFGLMIAASAAGVFAQTPGADDAYALAVAAVGEYRYAAALDHFQQAGAQGHGQAQQIAGLMLHYGPKLFGNEVQSDPARSEYWLEMAARQGLEVPVAMLKQLKSTSATVRASTEEQK